MYKITITFLFCAFLLMAQENLSLTQQLQNIDKLISERGNESTREQIMEKFNSTKRQNEQIAELINNPKITSKVDFDYAMDWTTEKKKIKAMHNNVYN